MPFVTGAIFFPPFVGAVMLLRWLPRPTIDDEAARTARRPMDGKQRRAFLRRFAGGLAALILLYVFLTAYRDIRDNFAPEIWAALGYPGKPEVFAAVDTPVAVVVLACLALLYRVRDNRRALLLVHALMAAGTLLVGVATLLFDAGLLGPLSWMLCIGVGLYLGYVPYGCMLFDRLIAATGVIGTAVFMIYVTDACGYAGSIALLVYKNFASPQLDWLTFFRSFSYATAAICTTAFAVSTWYFAAHTRPPRRG